MTCLADELSAALTEGRLDILQTTVPTDRRDRFLALQQIYDLHLAPLSRLGHRVVLQGDPLLAMIKQQLESTWIHELDTATDVCEPADVREALLDIAVADRVPPVYTWLAQEATWEELVGFLSVEGGPDAGFDDLVALCQVGLTGEAKLEMARNYWDEMGQGTASAVHTVLHEDLVDAAGITRVGAQQQPVEALERTALCGLLATNRYLQPEMVGALGMTELQAGPRCRLVVHALQRLDAPAATLPFYEEHAAVDPKHGHDWVMNAVLPLVAQHPEWARRILRGAAWRAHTNLAFFAALFPATAQQAVA